MQRYPFNWKTSLCLCYNWDNYLLSTLSKANWVSSQTLCNYVCRDSPSISFSFSSSHPYHWSPFQQNVQEQNCCSYVITHICLKGWNISISTIHFLPPARLLATVILLHPGGVCKISINQLLFWKNSCQYLPWHGHSTSFRNFGTFVMIQSISSFPYSDIQEESVICEMYFASKHSQEICPKNAYIRHLD